MHLEIYHLRVEFPCHEALAEEFHAVLFRLSAASAVTAAPSSPDGPRDALRCPQDVVAGRGIGRRWSEDNAEGLLRCRVSTVWRSCGAG